MEMLEGETAVVSCVMSFLCHYEVVVVAGGYLGARACWFDGWWNNRSAAGRPGDGSGVSRHPRTASGSRLRPESA